MAGGADARTWVLKPDAVRRSIAKLQAASIHPYFIAYLYLRHCAARRGSIVGLKPNWKADLGPYLEVAGASVKHPYYRPFWDGAADAGQHWLNGNLAGSFAYSSLRAGSPPLLVVDYDDESQTFSLRPDHWKLARKHLLGGQAIPAEALAVFLLRDFGFVSDEDTPPQRAPREPPSRFRRGASPAHRRSARAWRLCGPFPASPPGGGSPSAYSSEQKVRLRECGVSRSGSGGRSTPARRLSASATDGFKTEAK